MNASPVGQDARTIETDRDALIENEEGSYYYVSVAGSDENAGTDELNPFRTINTAVKRLNPGDTLLVMPGTYREEFWNVPGGTKWDEPVRIAAYDPDNRPILRPDAGAARVFTFADARSSYIEIDGFVIDAINVLYDAVKITWGGQQSASHDIRIMNSEIMNAPYQGILVTGATYGVSHNEFINLEVHDNGTTRHDHGFYISTPYNVVRESRVYNNAGWGIHNYGGDPSFNTYRNNQVFNNATAGEGGVGIGVYTGDQVKVYNNTIWGPHNVGINVRYGATNVLVSGNTISGAAMYGLEVGADITGAVLADNTFFDNPIDVAISTLEDVFISSVSVQAPDLSEPTPIRAAATGQGQGPGTPSDRGDVEGSGRNETSQQGHKISVRGSIPHVTSNQTQLPDMLMSPPDISRDPTPAQPAATEYRTAIVLVSIAHGADLKPQQMERLDVACLLESDRNFVIHSELVRPPSSETECDDHR